MKAAGHEDALPLEVLIAEWPPLRDIIKALQPDYVFVGRYIRTIPRDRVTDQYRLDAFVNGLFVVDVKAVRTNHEPLIEQDYLVQWRDGRDPGVSYYSGKPKNKRKIHPQIWKRIEAFCPEFGAHCQYHCPKLSHHYSGLADTNLPQEAPWPAYFHAAMEEARRLAGLAK